ncbi:MAG: PD40 domain-containing protein, partial [Geodermatophilaceae bacterium]|nr:PD40 domain-containing protein [Geodermatophilaceae bacterium]
MQSGGLLAVVSALPISLTGAPAAAAATAPSAILREGTNTMVAASSDGNWLALDLVVSIWVLPVRGGLARRLTVDDQDASRPSWSPDGSGLLLSSDRDRDRNGDGTYGIYRLDLASKQIGTVANGDGEEAEPTVSPDGTRVAFTVDALRIDEVAMDTGARRTLVPERAGSFVYGPSYSPTSGRLAHVRLTGPRSDLVLGDDAVTDGRDVFALPPSWLSDDEVVYTADGRIRRQLVDGDATDIPFAAAVPVVATRPEPKRVDVDSTGRRKALGIASPTASPDGKRIAFRALNALWIADVDGSSRPRRVVADGYFNSDPDFSPDGRSLLYASDRAGHADLWVHDIGRGVDRRLTGLSGAQLAPRYSPDGRRIAFQDQDGTGFVLDLDLDTT